MSILLRFRLNSAGATVIKRRDPLLLTAFVPERVCVQAEFITYQAHTAGLLLHTRESITRGHGSVMA